MFAENAVDYRRNGAEILLALQNVEKILSGRGIDKSLHHLIKLRASQMNKCAFCVDMHTREAREDGETNARLDHLVAWEHMPDYSDREKAAFAWVEALTDLSAPQDLYALRETMRKHFTEEEITSITSITAMINLWNRMQISNH